MSVKRLGRLCRPLRPAYVGILGLCTVLAGPLAAFTHPGMLHTAADLTRIQSNALGSQEPWKTSWALFQQFGPGSSYVASPVVNETIGVGQFEIRYDAKAAWDLALRWRISGDTACRDASIAIINAWTNTMQTYDPADNLSASRAAIGFGNAAEILIAGGAPWPAADVARLKSMMLNLLYPALNETKIAGMMGNQGIDAMSGLMAIAVFCDDQAKFDYVVDAYKNHPNCAVTAYIAASGQSGEHGRDQSHPTGGLSAFDEIARMALNQGVDLYSWSNNRLLAGYEFWCKYNLGVDDLPFQQFGVYTYTQPSQIDRGRLSWVNFESVVDYYITKGLLSSPYLQLAATRMRPDPWGNGALRYYTGPAVTSTQLIASGAKPVVSRLNNLAMGTAGNTNVNGTQFDVEAYDGRTSQQWSFTHLGMNIYTVINGQGKATDIPGASENTGTKVQLYTANTGVHQRWRAISNGDGTLSLLNLNSSMALAIANSQTSSGGLLIQETTFPNPGLSQRWTVGTPSTAVPAAPVSLGADSPDTGEVILTWAYSPITATYSVNRATSASGTYTPIATGISGMSYIDGTAVSGQSYFYTVTGTNVNGSGPDSAPLPAISGLPSQWSTTSIGTGATGGSVYDNVGLGFSVSGAGGDIGGSADSFHYLNEAMSGDGTITVRFTDLVYVSADKVGIMMRESTAAGSRMVTLMYDREATKALRTVYRASTGGGSTYFGTVPTNTALPVWLRLNRTGNVFTSSTSADGITWTTLGTATVTMAADIRVGLASTSRSTSTENTAGFDNLDVQMSGGFQGQDIGTVGTAGQSSLLNGVFTVKGAGGDVGGTFDSLRFVGAGLSGDGVLVARLSSATFATTMGKIGLMVRESTAANSRMVFIMLDRGATSTLRMAYRGTAGGSTSYTGSGPSSVTPPRWLKIQRVGNVFTTSHSTDGVTWTTLGSATVTMATNVQIGFAVCSRTTALATATFDNVSR